MTPVASQSAINATAPATEPRYDLLEGTESAYAYRPGGLHPIDIGDILADRYSIVHKLGHGGWSTIWLAKDQQLQKYVAVKLGIAGSGSREIEILEQLHDGGFAPAQSLIPRVLDHFVVHGPNGEHNAIVMEPAMVSLYDAKDRSNIWLFRLPVARAIAAQLVQAVAFLHHREFVHCGKPSSSNSALVSRS